MAGKVVTVKLKFPEKVLKKMASCEITLDEQVRAIIERGTSTTWFPELNQVTVKKVS